MVGGMYKNGPPRQRNSRKTCPRIVISGCCSMGRAEGMLDMILGHMASVKGAQLRKSALHIRCCGGRIVMSGSDSGQSLSDIILTAIIYRNGGLAEYLNIFPH